MKKETPKSNIKKIPALLHRTLQILEHLTRNIDTVICLRGEAALSEIQFICYIVFTETELLLQLRHSLLIKI